MFDINKIQVVDDVNPINPQYALDNVSQAPILGLGFHQFDGNTPVDEVIRQIGADFTVRKDHIARIPNYIMELFNNGSNEETITIKRKDIIDSHRVTVNEGDNSIIGVVGAEYGVIQNSEALDILNVITNPDESGANMKIVSAGLVHRHEPYIQISLPNDNLRINNDRSDTNFYCFLHTSHDGSSQLKVSFSAIRVVCQNTFMANMKSIGFAFKHSKNVGERVKMSKEENIKRVQEFVKSTKVFKEDYVNKMNFLANQPIDSEYFWKFIAKTFLSSEDLAKVKNDYTNIMHMDFISTRTKNKIEDFLNVVDCGKGQDAHLGSRLWMFNGLTNYFSNTVNYGGKSDDTLVKATKRFDSLNEGLAMRKINQALDMLVVA